MHIDGGIGCFDLHCAEGPIPILPDPFQRPAAGLGAAKTADQRLHVGDVPSYAEAEGVSRLLAGGQIKRHLHRAARIQPRSGFSGKPCSLEGRWIGKTAVPAQKLFPITGEGSRGFAHVHEGDTLGELGIKGIARQQGAGFEVHLGLHVQQALLAQLSQHPFPVAGDGQRRGPPRDVAQFQNGELHRRVHGHINRQFGDDAVLGVFEHGIAKAMTDDVGRRAARGQRRGRPELPGLLVPDVKGFPGGVGDGVVVPGRQAKLVAIFDPGVGAAALRNDRPEDRDWPAH